MVISLHIKYILGYNIETLYVFLDNIMARSHPGLKLLSNYLKTEFPFKKSYICKTSEIDQVFSYQDVKNAMKKLKTTDPRLHRLLSYRFMTNRSRSAIADSLYMDSSTLKRSWDKAMFILQNWLMHGVPEEGEQDPLIEKLDPIDLLYKE